MNPCRMCELHRKLDSNGACSKCNAARALKQCRKCRDILPLLMAFYEGRATCIMCHNRTRRPLPASADTPQQASRAEVLAHPP